MPEALNFARALDLDLVEVADKANPPVCRVMDYGKYKYEAAQKAKESRKKSTNVVVKEMKYRPKIGGGDFGTKTKKVEQFLAEGHKVKITIMFRGREVAHPELGKKILDRVAEEIVHLGRVEVFPKLDGPRNMIMILAPDKKAQAAHAADLKQAEEDAAEAAARTAALQEVEAAEDSAAQAAEGSAPAAEAPVEEAPIEEATTDEAPTDEAQGSEVEADEVEALEVEALEAEPSDATATED